MPPRRGGAIPVPPAHESLNLSGLQSYGMSPVLCALTPVDPRRHHRALHKRILAASHGQ
jgi:hypothetical protein